MTSGRTQVVLCVGPRCRARANLKQLYEAACALARQQPQRFSVGTYECLGRCPTGPNGLLRTLSPAADPEADPGYRDLDEGQPLSGLTVAALRALGDDASE